MTSLFPFMAALRAWRDYSLAIAELNGGLAASGLRARLGRGRCSIVVGERM